MKNIIYNNYKTLFDDAGGVVDWMYYYFRNDIICTTSVYEQLNLTQELGSHKCLLQMLIIAPNQDMTQNQTHFLLPDLDPWVHFSKTTSPSSNKTKYLIVSYLHTD